jgi:hypothetical protein
MVSFNPNSIHPGQSLAPRAKSAHKRNNRENHAERQQLLPPRERGYQHIPSQDNLQRLIERALEAVRAGIYWERGSILNITT